MVNLFLTIGFVLPSSRSRFYFPFAFVLLFIKFYRECWILSLCSIYHVQVVEDSDVIIFSVKPQIGKKCVFFTLLTPVVLLPNSVCATDALFAKLFCPMLGGLAMFLASNTSSVSAFISDVVCNMLWKRVKRVHNTFTNNFRF